MSQNPADAFTRPTPTVHPREGRASALERNIEALAERRRREEEAATGEQRFARAVSRFAGSMAFVAVHVLVIAAWVAINLRWTPLLPFDPTFVILATVASVEAIFISTFILIAQN